MNKELIRDLLTTLLEDCESQENSLRENLTKSWDCFYIGNWAAMSESIRLVAKELKIEID